MSQGRGSALVFATLVVMVAMVVVLQSGAAEAATTYKVGDGGGWTFNVAAWPSRKKFRAGDTLGKHKTVQESTSMPFLLLLASTH